MVYWCIGAIELQSNPFQSSHRTRHGPEGQGQRGRDRDIHHHTITPPHREFLIFLNYAINFFNIVQKKLKIHGVTV